MFYIIVCLRRVEATSLRGDDSESLRIAGSAGLQPAEGFIAPHGAAFISVR